MAASSPAMSNDDNAATTTLPASASASASASAVATISATNAAKNLRGLNKPKCIKCGNVARSSYELNKSKFIAYLWDVKLIYNTMIVWEGEGEHMEGKCAHISHARVAVQKLKIHVTYTMLTSNATFPDKIPSSSSSLFDQQSTDASSSGNSRRFTSLRQLSNNFAQFNNLQGPLRSRKTVTRKDAAVINEWRFLKLKEHKEGKIEVENEAFDRYMQNVSLLDEVLTVDSTPEGSTNNWPPRSENVTKRVQDIVNQGLRKLQKIELGNGDNDSSKQVELVGMQKKGKSWRAERVSALSDLHDKLNKAQNEEDLKYCLEMKPELFNHHQRTSQMETVEVIEISKQETANNEFSPGLQSDYSIPKWFCTANVDQDALDLIDVRFSSLEEIEAL
ncbi:unnamed protein product [Camellia sinensis]